MEYPERTLAEDPTTPAATLRRLADALDAQVREAVAANPNVPPDLLWNLAYQFPDAVLRNPALELLSLEDPLWLQRPTAFLLVQLLERPQAPAWFIEQVLSGPPAVLLLLAGRTQKTDVMWLLARRGATKKKLLHHLIYNPHVPTSLLEHLAAEHGMAEAVLRRAHRPDYFVEAALESGLFEGPSGEEKLARLHTLPPRHHELMAASLQEPLRRAVARAPEVSEALLTRLARDPSPRVREQVADHERCPEPLAQELRQTLPPRPRPSYPE